MLSRLVLLACVATAAAFVAPGRLPACNAVAVSRVDQAAVSMFGGSKKSAPKKAVKKAPVKKAPVKKLVKQAPRKKEAIRASFNKVNPALFSTGIDPKKIAAIKAQKAAEAAQKSKLTKAGLPLFNLQRLLPQRQKGTTRSTDGSLVFPKPWADQWGSPNFDKTRFK